MSELIRVYCVVCGESADFPDPPTHYICSDCAEREKETDTW